jgi:hypothetical protein
MKNRRDKMGEFELCMALLNQEGLNKQTEPLLDRMRSIEIETQWSLLWDFLDVLEEMYPDEFQNAYDVFNKKQKG